MAANVRNLRVGLVAASVLLVAVVAGTMGWTRYRAAKGWLERAKRRSGASVLRETDGFTYSQSMQGRTVFTLHAAKAFQHSDGLWTLHDVVITLYGLKDDRADRVYGNEFQWDDQKGIARAVSEVQMDLQVPAGVAAAGRSGGASGAVAQSGDAESIHVRTSGLVFLRQLGVAATQEQIEFRYKGLTCVAQGAEFDNAPSALHLLSKVQLHGEMQGAPVALTAEKADFDRTSNVVTFASPVLATRDRHAHAGGAVLHLRHDGSVERAEATGGVGLDAGTRHVASARLDAVMDGKSQPQMATFSGDVRVVDDRPDSPASGGAGELRVRFDAEGGPAEMTAVNGAHGLLRSRASGGQWVEREMRGQLMVAKLASSGPKGGKGGSMLQQVHVAGGAMMRGDSVTKSVAGAAGGMESTSVSADDLVVSLVPNGGGKVRVDRVRGRGHTVLRQTAPLGVEKVSSGDALDAVFAAEGTAGDAQQLAVASAVQEGHVVVTSRGAQKAVGKDGSAAKVEVAKATAARAVYDGAKERFSLSGSEGGGVHMEDGGTSLQALLVEMDQQSGDAEAQGNVLATLAGNGAQAAHVAAEHATLHKASQMAEFTGSPAKPARLWQAASQVEAATIVLDRMKRTLVARTAGGVVKSVFAGPGAGVGKAAAGAGMAAGAGNGGGAGSGAAARGPSVLRVESGGLLYDDVGRQATFAGPVHMQGATGDVRAQRANAFFAPAGNTSGKPAGNGGVAAISMPGGALDHVVVSGDVRVEQVGRRATGEVLTYRSGDGTFVLTGKPGAPPHVVDAQQGTVTGESLLFRAGDSTIVVAGAAEKQRARIDTHVKE